MVGQFLALWWTKTLERESLAGLPANEKFSGFVYIYICLRSIAIRSLWPTLQPTIGQNSFFYTWPHQLYESSEFGTYTYKVSLLVPIDFGYSLILVSLNTQKEEPLVRSPWFPASGEFSRLFFKCFEVSTWNLVYTLSKLHNILSSRFTRIRSLWPISCS